jgi:pheromone shutdown protein TraB
LLLALPRDADYVERREDGYQEPLCIVLLGTSHLSRRSAADVHALVTALQPCAVAVELCRGRAGALQAEGSSFSLSGDASSGGFGGAMMRTLRLGGGPALLLRAALANGPAAPAAGAEFRAAASAASAARARLVLADRPIEVSLRRALRLSSAAELVDACRALASAALAPRADAAAADAADDALMEAGAVERLLAGPLAAHPGAAAALLHERDAYMAWSCSRSKAVCGTRMVVAVLGAGHLRGVAWALQPQQRAQLRFDVLSGKQERAAEEAARPPLWRRLLFDSLAGLALWLAWEAANGASHWLPIAW